MFGISVLCATISADTMDFLVSLKSFAFVIIITLMCMIGSKVISFFNEKIKEQALNYLEYSKLAEIESAHRAMTDMIDLIHDTVERLNHTIKSEILKSSADGKLSREEGEQIFNEAMRIIKECASTSLIDDLSCIVGDVDEWIANQIEVWVATTKNTK